MKIAQVLSVFAILFFATLGNNARAENNPLLEIYNGIEAGMNFSSVKKVVENFLPHRGIKRRLHFFPLSLTYDYAFIKWTWFDTNYKDKSIAPTASLIVYFFVAKEKDKPRISKAVYNYRFLRNKKELEKSLKD